MFPLRCGSADARVRTPTAARRTPDLPRARARAIVATAAWDDVARKPGRDHTLGWILTHMVEEVARHVGHADLFRELIDGQTGE